MTKAQKALVANYRELGYKPVGTHQGNLVVARPLHSGRAGVCYQLIAPEGKTVRTFVRHFT